MKIFIAGARSVTALSPEVRQRMKSISDRGYDVIVGDCYGVDTAVQKFYSDLGYGNVTVFASGGRARNNVGNWNIRSIPVPCRVRGFDYYRQKDIAMAREADYGFMIWDGKSRGTLSNIVTLVSQNKKVLVYLTTQDRMFVIKNDSDLSALLMSCGR